MNNNFIKLKGIVHTQPKFSHTTHGENFLEFTLEVKRKSGVSDFLPITVSERMIVEPKLGMFVEINGEVRTFNKFIDGKSKLIITVFVKEMFLPENEEYENSVELNGFICKQPIIRETPVSMKSICDILLALNGTHNRTSYIPCIAWNKQANFISELPVGTQISIKGKLQSRIYNKKLNETESEKRTAYEVSISTIDLIEKGE